MEIRRRYKLCKKILPAIIDGKNRRTPSANYSTILHKLTVIVSITYYQIAFRIPAKNYVAFKIFFHLSTQEVIFNALQKFFSFEIIFIPF